MTAPPPLLDWRLYEIGYPCSHIKLAENYFRASWQFGNQNDGIHFNMGLN